MLSFLLYHEIGPQPRSSANLDCFCTEKHFRSQMQFLKDHAVPVLSPTEACAFLSCSDIVEPHGVVLTFDDADISFLEYALPILKELDFPSALFAVAGKIGTCASWVKDPRNAIPLMNGEQLRSLRAHRVELGSHSMSHRKLTELTENQALSELRDSRAILEDILGNPVRSFAYPHGRYNIRIMELAASAGYLDAYSTDGQCGFSGPSVRLRVPRKYITYHDDLHTFSRQIGYNINIPSNPTADSHHQIGSAVYQF